MKIPCDVLDDPEEGVRLCIGIYRPRDTDDESDSEVNEDRRGMSTGKDMAGSDVFQFGVSVVQTCLVKYRR